MKFHMMKKQQKRMIQAAVLLIGLLFIALGYRLTTIEDRTPVEPTAESLTYSDVTYQLTWRNDMVWSSGVTNDLGYTIWLDEGYLTNATVELIPCLRDAGEDATTWFPQTAEAGHGTDEADDSRLLIVYVDSLTDLTPTEVGTRSVSDEIYCQAHVLFSPSLIESTGADIDMTSRTIVLNGRYQSPTSNEQVPFAIETDIAWGALVDLQTAAGGVATLQTGFAPATIVIQRDVTDMFTGLDFVAMTGQEQEMAILRTIANSVQVTVE